VLALVVPGVIVALSARGVQTPKTATNVEVTLTAGEAEAAYSYLSRYPPK
jgi:hypothetical protein